MYSCKWLQQLGRWLTRDLNKNLTAHCLQLSDLIGKLEMWKTWLAFIPLHFFKRGPLNYIVLADTASNSISRRWIAQGRDEIYLNDNYSIKCCTLPLLLSFPFGESIGRNPRKSNKPEMDVLVDLEYNSPRPIDIVIRGPNSIHATRSEWLTYDTDHSSAALNTFR